MSAFLRYIIVFCMSFLMTDALGFSSSNLPVISITTNNREIARNYRISANIGVIFNGQGQRNYSTDEYNHFYGNIEIRTRGNSTAGWPKKPYDFKIVDESGEDLHVPLLGMAAHEDWILLASYLDHTFIRTPLSKHMSGIMGRWASDSRMVEVFLNGEYQGIYILIEKIARSNRRLGVDRLLPDQVSEEEITGGYIYEISGNKGNFGETRHLRYPNFDRAAPEQISYIRQYDNGFRNAMRLQNYTEEYDKWIDVDSFVDELLVQEAMRNSDAYGWSSYFHKRRGEKLMAGPVWDFDQSAGNSSYPDNGVATGWLYSHPHTNNTPFFWKKLMEDPAFSYKVKKRWQELRKDEYSTDNLFHYIDSIASLLSEAQQREFEKWPVLGVYFWRETNGFQYRTTYKAEVDYLKSFLGQRWAWMDREIARIPDYDPDNPDSGSVLSAGITRVYPNPVNDHLNLTLESDFNTKATIYIYSLPGVQVCPPVTISIRKGTNNLSYNLSDLSEPGFYIYKVVLENTVLSYSGRFLKMKL